MNAEAREGALQGGSYNDMGNSRGIPQSVVTPMAASAMYGQQSQQRQGVENEAAGGAKCLDGA